MLENALSAISCSVTAFSESMAKCLTRFSSAVVIGLVVQLRSDHFRFRSTRTSLSSTFEQATLASGLFFGRRRRISKAVDLDGSKAENRCASGRADFRATWPISASRLRSADLFALLRAAQASTFAKRSQIDGLPPNYGPGKPAHRFRKWPCGKVSDMHCLEEKFAARAAYQRGRNTRNESAGDGLNPRSNVGLSWVTVQAFCRTHDPAGWRPQWLA